MRLKNVLLCTLALMGVGSGSAQQQDVEHMVFKVGEVYYFGYGGLNLSALRSKLPLHAGDSFSYATFDDVQV